MTVKAILGLTNPWLKITGSALFDGQELVGLKGNTLRKNKRKKNMYDTSRRYDFI